MHAACPDGSLLQRIRSAQALLLARNDNKSGIDELQVGLDNLLSIISNVISFNHSASSRGYMIAAQRGAKLLHSTSWEAQHPNTRMIAYKGLPGHLRPRISSA